MFITCTVVESSEAAGRPPSLATTTRLYEATVSRSKLRCGQIVPLSGSIVKSLSSWSID